VAGLGGEAVRFLDAPRCPLDSSGLPIFPERLEVAQGLAGSRAA